MRFDRGRDGESSYVTAPRPAEEVASLRERYAREHVVRVSALLAPDLLAEVRAEVTAAPFAERDDGGIAQESTMGTNGVLPRLVFIANDPRFLDFVRSVTGAADVVAFYGRVYRFSAAQGHHDSWHDDCNGERRVALSVNLSDGPIEGGGLELRAKGTTDTRIHAYGEPGDALLFRVDETLEHRVESVRSATPRTTLAGWFMAADPAADG